MKREYALEEALGHAMRRGVIVVAAAGNQGTIGSSAITRHTWVIPVTACDLQGRPLGMSNLAGSIGKRGLGAPGDRITSLGTDGEVRTFSGTSFAVPFVVGTIALLWSAFPTSTAAEVRAAVTQSHRGGRTSVAPPLLDASAAYHMLAALACRCRWGNCVCPLWPSCGRHSPNVPTVRAGRGRATPPLRVANFTT
jgi:subtilisin family serine protease